LATAAEALAGVPMPAVGADEADAVLCALTATCCDDQVRSLERGCRKTSSPWETASPAARSSCGRRGGSTARIRPGAQRA